MEANQSLCSFLFFFPQTTIMVTSVTQSDQPLIGRSQARFLPVSKCPVSRTVLQVVVGWDHIRQLRECECVCDSESA